MGRIKGGSNSTPAEQKNAVRLWYSGLNSAEIQHRTGIGAVGQKSVILAHEAAVERALQQLAERNQDAT